MLLAMDPLVSLIAALIKKTSPDRPGDDDLAGHLAEHEGFVERFTAHKTRMSSPDIEERHRGRAALVDEFRTLFEGVVLHPDRVVTLHVRAPVLGQTIVYAVSCEGTAIQLRSVEGIIGFIAPSALAGLLPPVASGKSTKAKHGKNSEQSDDVAAVLARMQIIRSSTGDWQAFLHDPLQMADVVSRAEDTLVASLP